MPTPYGTFSVYGVQSGLPGGGSQSLGPFLIPFSNCQNSTQYDFPSAGSATFDIPGGASDPNSPVPNGVWIIPSGYTGSGAFDLNFGGGGFSISSTIPTFISFNPAYLEASFTLTAPVAMAVTIQYV